MIKFSIQSWILFLILKQIASQTLWMHDLENDITASDLTSWSAPSNFIITCNSAFYRYDTFNRTSIGLIMATSTSMIHKKFTNLPPHWKIAISATAMRNYRWKAGESFELIVDDSISAPQPGDSMATLDIYVYDYYNNYYEYCKPSNT